MAEEVAMVEEGRVARVVVVRVERVEEGRVAMVEEEIGAMVEEGRAVASSSSSATPGCQGRPCGVEEAASQPATQK